MPLALAFAAALCIVILLAGPLLLFNPWFTSALQERHGVAAEFGAPRAEIDRVTAAILGDLYVGGDFDVTLDGRPLLDERERSHMADVSRLVRLLAAIALAALAAAVAGAIALRREPRRQGRLMLVAAASLAAGALLLAAVFAVAFDAAFLAFHAVFFPPGTYLFEPGSDLIRLFPGGFWFDATLSAGAAIVVTAALVAAIGAWRLCSPRRRPAAEA